MKKSVGLVSIVILVASSMMMETALAQSMPKPSVPEFTVRYVDYSYDVSPTTSTTTSPYSGKQTVTTYPGYHVENKTLEIRIRNQPFTPYTNELGRQVDLHYIIRSKGHFGEDWPPGGDQEIANTLSDYTVILYDASSYLAEDQIDFQIQAKIGYTTYVEGKNIFDPNAFVFHGELSDWSNTQTIKIPGTSVTVSPSPTVPELSWLAILPLLVVMTLVATLFSQKRRVPK